MTDINRSPRLLQFNKSNGKFITAIEPVPLEWLNQDNYNYSEEVEFSDIHDMVIGDWDSWEIVLKTSQPFDIYEDSINADASDRILRTYPIAKQINIIGNVLEQLADSAGVDCEALKEMNDFVTEIRRTNALRKEFFANSPDYNYVSSEDYIENLNRKYEGAVENDEQPISGI